MLQQVFRDPHIFISQSKTCQYCYFVPNHHFFLLSSAETASLAAALLAALPSLASAGSRSKRAFFDAEVDEDLDEARFDEARELGRALQKTAQVYFTHLNLGF